MRFPAFMFWPERYWLDAYDLTDAEHGIYLRLMIIQWNCPTCRMPNENTWIARKMGRSVQSIENEVRPVLQRFFKSDGNWVWQKKLLDEFERLVRMSKRGTDANKSRWGKKKDASQIDPTILKQGVGPTPTPTPTPTIKPVETAKAKERAPASRWPPNKEVGFEWKFDAEQKRREMSLPDIDLHLEGEKFANFWSAKSGKDATKVDWHRTWINWCLNAKGSTNGNGKAPSAHDKFFAAAASLIRDELGRGEADQGDGDAAALPHGRPLLPS